MIDNLKTVFLVLARPKRAFAKVDEKQQIAVWLTAIIMISITLLAKPVLTAPAMRAQSQKALKATLAQMEKDEAKAQMKRALKTGTPPALIMISGVFESIALWLGVALSALVIMGLVKLLKGTIAYKAALAVIGLAFMPFFVGEIIKIVAAAATGGMGLSEGMASLITPAAGPAPVPMTSGPGHILAVLTLSRIDIFVIWSLVLLSLGITRATGLSKVKGAALAISYWTLAWALAVVPTGASLLLFAPMMRSSVQSGP